MHGCKTYKWRISAWRACENSGQSPEGFRVLFKSVPQVLSAIEWQEEIEWFLQGKHSKLATAHSHWYYQCDKSSFLWYFFQISENYKAQSKIWDHLEAKMDPLNRGESPGRISYGRHQSTSWSECWSPNNRCAHNLWFELLCSEIFIGIQAVPTGIFMHLSGIWSLCRHLCSNTQLWLISIYYNYMNSLLGYVLGVETILGHDIHVNVGTIFLKSLTPPQKKT